MLQTGVYSVSDLLTFNQNPITNYDPNAIAQALADRNAAHNALVNQMLSALVEETAERVGGVPAPGSGEMIRVNEDAAVQTRKESAPSQQNYPLYKFQHAEGLLQDYLMRATPADLATRQMTVERTHLNSIRREMLRGLLYPVNRQERDRFRDGMLLNIKALANGDDVEYFGANGGSVASGHSHYLAGTLDKTNLDALIGTVQEHTETSNVQVWVARGQEDAVRALVGFSAYLDSRVIPAMLAGLQTAGTVGAAQLDTSNPTNRAIGVYGGAEIFVKPYMPDGYVLAIDAGRSTKPLRKRVSDLASQRGLRLAGGTLSHPLENRYWEDYFGFAAHDRTAAAVLDTLHDTYQPPAGLMD